MAVKNNMNQGAGSDSCALVYVIVNSRATIRVK